MRASLAAPAPEASGRRIAERLALALAGAALFRYAPQAVSDAFTTRRMLSTLGARLPSQTPALARLKKRGRAC